MTAYLIIALLCFTAAFCLMLRILLQKEKGQYGGSDKKYDNYTFKL